MKTKLIRFLKVVLYVFILSGCTTAYSPGNKPIESTRGEAIVIYDGDGYITRVSDPDNPVICYFYAVARDLSTGRSISCVVVTWK